MFFSHLVNFHHCKELQLGDFKLPFNSHNQIRQVERIYGLSIQYLLCVWNAHFLGKETLIGPQEMRICCDEVSGFL